MDQSTPPSQSSPEDLSSRQHTYPPQGYYQWAPRPAYIPNPYWRNGPTESAHPSASGASVLPQSYYAGSLAPYTPYHMFSSHGSSQQSTPITPIQNSDYRPPLVNSNSTVNHHPVAAPSCPPAANSSSKKRKRGAADGPVTSTSKKRATRSTHPHENAENIPPIHGAGPQSITRATTSLVAIHASLSQTTPAKAPISFESVIPRNTNVSGADASDVWYFVRGLLDEERPAVAPIAEPISRKQPDQKKYDFLLCRLCG